MQTSISLSVHSAAEHVDKDIKLVLAARYLKRLADNANLFIGCKVFGNVFAVNYDFACAFAHKYAGNCCFSSSCSNSNILNHDMLLIRLQAVWDSVQCADVLH